MTEALRWTATLAELQPIAQKMAQIIAHDERGAQIILSGDLGAGKTTLVGEILYALGLPRSHPVTSPTFALIHDYEIKTLKVVHADFYRLLDQSPGQWTRDLDHVLSYEPDIAFLEWAADVRHPLLNPTHHIRIIHESADQRTYLFEEFNR